VAAGRARGLGLDGLARHGTGSGPPGLVVGFAAPARAELEAALPVLTDVLGGG
jgi:hypothetical protein